ncbi:Uncharacterised protein [Segatella copri]|nr:Uncharacterised protein [Segatella copri]
MIHDEDAIIQLSHILFEIRLHSVKTCVSNGLAVSRQPIADFSCLYSHNIMYLKDIVTYFSLLPIPHC